MAQSSEEIDHAVAVQWRAAVLIGGALVFLGLCILFFSAVPGLLIILLGVLVFGLLKIDSAVEVFARNQCVTIELQHEIIAQLKKLNDSSRSPPTTGA